DDYQIFAQGFHTLLLVRAESPAQPHQQDDGSNSPDDAKHGQEHPHFMGFERGYCLVGDLQKIHELSGLGRNTGEDTTLELGLVEVSAAKIATVVVPSKARDLGFRWWRQETQIPRFARDD